MMMALIMFNLLVTLAFALSFVGSAERAAPALAPPANDSLSGAKLVTIGFSESLDTSEATTDADDATVNSACGFPATDASVWYQFVGTGEKVSLNVFQSDYSASVIATSNPNVIFPPQSACGLGGVDFVASAGVTYYILAFDDQRDGVGSGGLLNISLSLAPPPPDLTVTVTVENFGSVNARTGVVTMSGTYSCVNADSLNLYVAVVQELGRGRKDGEIDFRAFGDASAQFQGNCDGNLHPWSAEVHPFEDPDFRKFVGGKATTTVLAHSEGPHGWSDYAGIERLVTLRGK
jgi:hypothetical protein